MLRLRNCLGLGTFLGMPANVTPLTTESPVDFCSGSHGCWGKQSFTRQSSQWVCQDTGACSGHDVLKP